MFIGPLISASNLSSTLQSAEATYPDLIGYEKWDAFKSAMWVGWALFAGLSVWAGWGLSKGGDRSVVRRAKFLIWICGPVAVVVSNWFIPFLFFGPTESDPVADKEGFAALAIAVFSAVIWTLYLTKSKRVLATYGNADALPAVVRAGSIQDADAAYAKKDFRCAFDLYRSLAQSGVGRAQFCLGSMYAQGQGIPKNDQQAYFWWLLAAVDGDDKAIRHRDSMELHLTSEQRAGAQADASNWTPIKP